MLSSLFAALPQSSVFARMLANVLVAGSGVLIRAVTQAYRQAVISAPGWTRQILDVQVLIDYCFSGAMRYSKLAQFRSAFTLLSQSA